MCYLWRICAITYYCKVVVGPGTQLCRLLDGWVLGVGMSTLGRKRPLYAEDRGPPTTDDPSASPVRLCRIGPDPQAEGFR